MHDGHRAAAARGTGTLMDLLQQLVTIFAENGYVAVFIALMICGAGLPLPEDITLVAGGVIAGLGYANVHAMFALAMFGVLLGDCAIFLDRKSTRLNSSHHSIS